MGKKNKKQTVGYKYFVGAHLVLCHGPIDRILKIYVDDKLLWTPLHDGQGIGIRGDYENIHMDAPDLFGGEDREGGISGDIEIGMGYREQGRSGYLSRVLANKLLPAYRGVVSVILKQIYCGTSPYLKPWKFRAQRIWAPTATDKLQWSPPNAGIGLPGDQYLLRDIWAQGIGQFSSASTMIDGRLYTVRVKIVDAEILGRPISASTPSGITVTVHDYINGKVSWEDNVARKAPYSDFYIMPMTDDVIVIDGGRKFLFPLCLDAVVTSGSWDNPLATWSFRGHYAAIFDPIEKTVQRIPYPASSLMSMNRRLVYPAFNSAGARNYLGPRFAAAWDDDIDGHYIVMGPAGFTYRLIPLRGQVVALHNALGISNNAWRLGYQKAPQRRLFVIWYTTFDVQGVKRDQLNAALYDTETGMKIWESGPTLIPGGYFMSPWDADQRVAELSDISIVCGEDRFVYVFLSRTMAAYFGKRVLIYNTNTPNGSLPATSNMGLPWYKYTGLDVGTLAIKTSWYKGHSCGKFKQARVGADGRFYGFSILDTEPGVILSNGKGPGLVPGGASPMGWYNKGDPSHAAEIDAAVFVWHGTPVAITPRWVGSTSELDSLTPLNAPDGGASSTISPGPWDMNPIHIIRECMTNTEWGRGLPDSIIGPSYAKAAETIYKERLGLSMIWTSEMPINDFILEVIRHIDAVRYEDPETGLQEIKLIRPDYAVATLPVLSPSNCRLEQLTEPTLYDLVNQVTVNFWNRETGEDSAIAAQDTASINMTGTVNNQAIEYSGICSTSVALMVAQRDLARYSKPFRQGRLIVNRKVANLKPGDPFILTWPARGVDRLVCRAALRSDNGELDGQLGIEFGEDIFSQSYNIASVPPPSGWEDPITPPKNFDHVTMFDVPYVMLVDLAGEAEAAATPNDTSYAGFAGARPLTGMHLQYGCFVYPAGTTPPTDSQKEIRESFTPLGITGEDVAQFTDPVITLPLQVANDMGNARVGDWVLVGNAADRDREVLCIAEDPGNTPVAIKVTRATADTYPRAIPKGTPLYLVGTFYAYDEIERVSGEAVAGYGAPKNGKGSYPGPFTYLQIDMVGRQGLPYPAAGFQVDGSYQDDLATEKKRVTLTWHHRNRIQQANQALSWLASSDVPLEAGVSYHLRRLPLDANLAPLPEMPVIDMGAASSYQLDMVANPMPAGAAFADLIVEAHRGELVSLQNRAIRIAVPAQLTAPTGLFAQYVDALSAPTGLTANYSAALSAPTGLTAQYSAALLQPTELTAQYSTTPLAPTGLFAQYSAALLPPTGLLAQYSAALLQPTELTAQYSTTPLAPTGLFAQYVEALPPAPTGLHVVSYTK